MSAADRWAGLTPEERRAEREAWLTRPQRWATGVQHDGGKVVVAIDHALAYEPVCDEYDCYCPDSDWCDPEVQS